MRSLYAVVFLAALLPATCAAEQTTPSVTRSRNGPALTGSVVVGVNETISIWCSANATVMFMGRMELKGLFWRYSNGTRVPVVDRGEPSDLDVYAERYSGIAGAGTKTWRRVLHFTTAQPSAGNYTCVAKYNQTLRNQSIEVRVTDIDCGDPGTPKNGRCTLSSTLYTSEVIYTCDVGYTLQGSDKRTCQSNGQWSGSVPQCTHPYSDINCGDPGTPTNGQRTLSSTTYNSVVIYTCTTHYVLHGLKSRTCQSNGNWSGSVPLCKVFGCGDPGTPTNGQRNVSGSSTTYYFVTYTCDEGYTRQGSDRRICLSNGQWSGSVPQCNAYADINCGGPGTPTNGQRSLSSTTYNSVVTYTCDVGYTLQGSNSVSPVDSGVEVCLSAMIFSKASAVRLEP